MKCLETDLFEKSNFRCRGKTGRPGEKPAEASMDWKPNAHTKNLVQKQFSFRKTKKNINVLLLSPTLVYTYRFQLSSVDSTITYIQVYKLIQDCGSLKSAERRTFCYVAPRMWNELPRKIRKVKVYFNLRKP